MKQCLVYFPGFRSNPFTEKAKAVEAVCSLNGIRFVPFNYTSYDVDVIDEQIAKIVENNQHPTWFGTSLGGYLALRASDKHGGPVLVVNPSLNPAVTLKRNISYPIEQFNGELVHCDDRLIEKFPQRTGHYASNRYGTNVILCHDDEVLSATATSEYFSGSAEIEMYETGGHRAQGVDIIKALQTIFNRN